MLTLANTLRSGFFSSVRQRGAGIGHAVGVSEDGCEALGLGVGEAGAGEVVGRVAAQLERVAERGAARLQVGGDEEVDLVLDDGAAQAQAVLQDVVVEEGRVILVARELLVLPVAEDRAVEVVGAALGDGVHHAAGEVAVAHVEGRDLHDEGLDRLDATAPWRSPDRPACRRAARPNMSLYEAPSIWMLLNRLFWPAIEPPLDLGRGGDEVREVTALQRQLDHLLAGRRWWTGRCGRGPRRRRVLADDRQLLAERLELLQLRVQAPPVAEHQLVALALAAVVALGADGDACRARRGAGCRARSRPSHP